MKKNPIIVIHEWDGDGTSAAGGFELKLRGAGKTTLVYSGRSYDTAQQRATALRGVRRRAKTLSEILGLKIKEEVF